MTTLRDELLRFVSQLRGAGVRISIAETLDAMNAIVAAGLERAPMREALAATLIKDEDDRHIFDELFATFFASRRTPSDDGWRKPGTESSVAPGSGRIESESIRAVGKDKKPAPFAVSEKSEPREELETESGQESEEHREGEAEREDSGREEIARRPRARNQARREMSSAMGW